MGLQEVVHGLPQKPREVADSLGQSRPATTGLSVLRRERLGDERGSRLRAHALGRGESGHGKQHLESPRALKEGGGLSVATEGIS